ncbi:hypothetical protein ACFFGH_10750 [Lysobacter korlensis]|uniref:Uncharacterized protein n=1 Tax=Lysobacter korlensis TaxID=553636 RepID=A0ABV6RMV8_9GAMM
MERLGATIYIEAGIAVTGEQPEFTFTLQKRTNPTPRDLRMQAEAKLDAVRAVLDGQPDSDLAAELRAVLDG